MFASDVMNRNVVSVPPGTPVKEAVRLMVERGVSGLPVVDAEGRLAGIVTEGDFLRRAELGTERRRSAFVELLRGPGLHAGDYVRANARSVDEIMATDVACVEEDAPLREVVDLMERRRVRRVPVVSDGRLVGLISRRDLLAALGRMMQAAPVVQASDAEIRRVLLARLEAFDWFPRASLRVELREGVVTLEGLVTSEPERRALIVAAENVPGVRAVEDRLEFLDAATGIVGLA